jgi:hypothetical protein
MKTFNVSLWTVLLSIIKIHAIKTALACRFSLFLSNLQLLWNPEVHNLWETSHYILLTWKLEYTVKLSIFQNKNGVI